MKSNATFPVAPQWPAAVARKFWSVWKLPAQLSMVLCLLLLGAAQTFAASSIWSDGDLPANPAADDPNAVEVGLKFRSTVSGYITGIRFYKGPGNEGTHVGRLWTSGGGLLASTTFGAETASGWQQQALPAPVPIAANTTYVVSYHAPQGQYAVDVGYFVSSGLDNAPLRALADGENGPNGVYSYGASGTFPTQTFNGANYWVDVVFQETVESDTTAPTVSQVNPASGASGVSVATAVTVVFSESMDASTINEDTVVLRDASANQVPATVSYLDPGLAVLIPTSPLNSPHTYTVTVGAGAAGVKDVAGNPLATTFSSAFTTGGDAAFSIWDNATTPFIASANDQDAIEVGLKFQSAISGSVTGIRFYKGPANNGPHVGSLWTVDGTLLATVLFENETDLGWQTQALPTPVPIESNTTYIVSYHTAVGGYAVDVGYFAAGGVDSDPLWALADGEAGGNGVFAYSPSSTFPNQTFNAANYWVDVVLTIPTGSGCEGDVTPPTIVAPPDVILTGGDCNTDPSNTGTALATDECSVIVTYRDVVWGDWLKVVTRTWIATDGAGNVATAVQSITCLPTSIVTDGSGCVFDRDPGTPVQDFRLIFIQNPKKWPTFRLVASNPGQFAYNVFYSGVPGQTVTFNVTVPYPFVTKGAKPIQAYDGVTVVTKSGRQYLSPGALFFTSGQQVKLADYQSNPSGFRTIPLTLTVPASGEVYLKIHLEYGLKGTSGFTKNASDDAIDSVTHSMLIPNQGLYQFAVTGAVSSSASIQNENDFKRLPALAKLNLRPGKGLSLLQLVVGLVQGWSASLSAGAAEDAPGISGLMLRQGTNVPVQGVVVKVRNARGKLIGFDVTDEDGFYKVPHKHTGRAATYSVAIITPPPVMHSATKTANLKANQSAQVDFSVP